VSTISSSTPLPQYIMTLIEVTVHRTVGRYHLTESDRDDLEQQIAMEVIRRRSKFDSEKAQENTFLARLVKHARSDILDARKAACRDYRREKAVLSQWVQLAESTHPFYNEWATRGELVTEQDVRSHRCGPSTAPEELRDLAIDLADAASRLSPRLREIFEHYAVLGSAREVAKATGLHHSSVYDALKQIKQHLEAAGLEVYLSKRRANPTDSDTRR